MPSGDEEPGTLPTRGLAWTLTIGGLLGLVAAIVLLVEKIALIKDPDYVPTCSINPVLSCGSVMNTAQAEVFGIPNPIIGIVGFTAVAMLGAALLAGARLHRWFWWAAQAGVSFGVVFVHWLICQSLYVIGALCPYCMVVWAVMIPIFWVTTLHNLRSWATTGSGVRRVAGFLTSYQAAILTAWFVVIVGLVAVRFWDYWVTLV
ncbi:putative membrane protein [Nocardioides daedukensis]|uniref:Putative membrane protein n=1 Tax=Nocardioides daedukensis TaxID=634462 RepID=A0A7Y9S400_9ACTN|nr:vitamin K epoxide reductase family protein [Nocardioides daedukensis]NYG59304.1 putative membrane protein [Nocardioides daedukensis]